MVFAELFFANQTLLFFLNPIYTFLFFHFTMKFCTEQIKKNNKTSNPPHSKLILN
ncbi:hypothetical protein QN326_04480 [Candidatus Phytoplasma asteris]|uniref:Uncharacterized protein n=1 Tax=Candidatus Phytoplasma asteris TaxID=85620 RepID=A0ABZ3CGE4_9MOLU